jgi:hypothetical protein
MTLRPAHDVPDRAELIRKIAEAEPTRPREIDPSIPLDLETVILKSLEADPERRYASAGAMADDLGRFLDGLPVLARRPGLVELSTRWVGGARDALARPGSLRCLFLPALVVRAASAWPGSASGRAGPGQGVRTPLGGGGGSPDARFRSRTAARSGRARISAARRQGWAAAARLRSAWTAPGGWTRSASRSGSGGSVRARPSR